MLHTGSSTKEVNKNCFLRGGPEMSRINAFYTYFLGKYWQIKTKQLKSEYFTFSRKSDF